MSLNMQINITLSEHTIGIIIRVFANGPGDGFHPSSNHTKDSKNGS